MKDISKFVVKSDNKAIKLLKKYPFLLIVFLCALNFILLFRVNSLNRENSIWRYKVTLSIEEQVTLFEHSIEGKSFNSEINELKQSNQFNNLLNNRGNKIIYYFSGSDCRRCLNMEMKFLNNYRSFFDINGITPIAILADFSNEEYNKTIKQYRIQNITIKGDSLIFRKIFSEMSKAIILFLSKSNHILLANVSDFQKEEKSMHFYNKIIYFFQ